MDLAECTSTAAVKRICAIGQHSLDHEECLGVLELSPILQSNLAFQLTSLNKKLFYFTRAEPSQRGTIPLLVGLQDLGIACKPSL